MAGRRIPPPKPGHPVPKEYVRQQLYLLGIKNVSEKEVEAYASDLTQLIKDTLGYEDAAKDPVYPKSVPTRPTNAHLQHHLTSKLRPQHATPDSKHYAPPNNTPQSPPGHTSPGPSYGHGSAIFKTFPGDKENKICYLSPSPSPSPLRLSPGKLSPHRTEAPGRDHLHRGGHYLSEHYLSDEPSHSERSASPSAQHNKHFFKRKVMRKSNGESKVVDESVSDLERELYLARYLSELSLTSVSSTEPETTQRSKAHYHHPQCCKSFIRPPTPRPLKKTDPVKRYHEMQKVWGNFKPPEEQSRSALRWKVRELLMHQDVPYYEPQRRVHQPNKYVVPTEKKRLALRWEVRRALAHQENQ